MIFVLVNRFLDVTASSCKIWSVFLVSVFDFTNLLILNLAQEQIVALGYAPIIGLPRTIMAFVFQLFVCCLKIGHCSNDLSWVLL
jgi:hypothetical protein